MENFKVGIHDWNDNVVQVHIGTLISWKGALKLELLGMSHSRGKMSTAVREFLSAPSHLTVEYLLEYISESLEDITSQLDARIHT